MHLVPHSIPEILTPAARKALVNRATERVASILQFQLGDNDPHKLVPEVLGNALAAANGVGSGFNPTVVGDAFDAMVSKVVGGQLQELVFVHEYLLEHGMTAGMPWIEDFADRQACAFDNDNGYRVFAVKTAALTYFACIIAHTDDAGCDSVYELHVRSVAGAEQSLQQLSCLESGEELARRFTFRGPRDEGYILSLMPEESSPAKWSAVGSLAFWPSIAFVFNDMANLSQALRSA
jgi:hypothetical protein